ncbi:MAG: hypothetical protein U0835_22610 [Isosphaeraceae bacterium]
MKGKYSIVPYPACVGWLIGISPDGRGRELQDSLDLVRTVMTPDWDIHPEMVSHTWVLVDAKTGRPFRRSPTGSWRTGGADRPASPPGRLRRLPANTP